MSQIINDWQSNRKCSQNKLIFCSSLNGGTKKSCQDIPKETKRMFSLSGHVFHI